MDEREKLKGVLLTPLKIIKNPKGDILHALKNTEASFSEFGEAYFSMVNQGEVKGWKKHLEMELNIVVPVGAIRFYIIDDRKDNISFQRRMTVELSISNYCRMTVPAGCWMAFEGIEKNNMLLNIASIPHNPLEEEVRDLTYMSLE